MWPRTLKWEYGYCVVCLAVIGLGALWHDTTVVIAGLGALGAPVLAKKADE